ncbi:MAG: Ig-like domain-containing protein [Clostridia bacterium]|nr:Ig-like domain-containing protein [Clostridia bacterium]
MKKSLMCILSTFFAVVLACSFSFSVGAEHVEILPTTQLEELQPATDDGVGLPSNINLAETVSETTGKPYFPALRNQYGGSCTAWATAYYQFTYQVAKEFDFDIGSANMFSPYYLWNYYNEGNEERGVYYYEAYDFLSKNGCLRWLDYSPTPYCNSWYNAGTDLQALYEALEYRVSLATYEVFAYDQTNATTPIITGNKDADLNKMKRLLSDGYTLTIETPTDSPKIGYAGGYPVTFYSQRVPESGKENQSHAVLIVGYDDNLLCDANGNGVFETQEKGAFLVADSFNNLAEVGRFYWIMYDALNNCSNYNSGYTQTYRVPGINYCKYWYIDVEEYTPQLTVEITLEQKYRNDITVNLIRKSVSGTSVRAGTFLKGYEDNTSNTSIAKENKLYNIDFNGNKTNPQYDSRTFVFDYGAYGLYSGDNYYYGIEIKDITDNNAVTTVEKIVWKNGNTVIKQIAFADGLDGETQTYYTAAKHATGISLSKLHQNLKVGDSHSLTATVTPTNATDKTLVWTSSNENCVTVTQGGVVTAVAPGTATVTATTIDGTGLTASCTYKVIKVYGDTWEDAVNCSYGRNETAFSQAGDGYWIKYVPAQSGYYLFYSESSFDLKVHLFNSAADEIGENDNISSSDKNFLLSAYLTAGQTYRLYITSPTNSQGEFAFYVMKREPFDIAVRTNADARMIPFSLSVPNIFNRAVLDIDGYEVELSIGANGIVSNNGIRVMALTNPISELYGNNWAFLVDISEVDALVGTTIDIEVEFFRGNVSSGTYNVITNDIAYKTTLLSGVEVSENNSLQLLLNDIDLESGEYLTVLDSNKQPITVTSTIKASTGMIILRKSTATNKIKEVMFVIVVGDVQGDGYINSLDASVVVQYDAELEEITGVYLIAADANIDGDVNSLDSTVILQHDALLIEISQNLGCTEAPVRIYYDYPVGF